MKKIIIYLLLSLILVVPIATMAAIAIMSSGDVEYSFPSTFSNNLNDLVTDQLSNCSIKEELTTTGRLTTSTVEILEVPFQSEEKLSIYYSEGDFIPAGQPICSADGAEYPVDRDCFLLKLKQKENKLVFSLQPTEVSSVEVLLPVETYCHVNDSFISFRWGEVEYSHLPCTDSAVYAQYPGEKFAAQYAVSGDNFLFGGNVSVTVETGRHVENVLSAPVQCFFREDDGRYYIQLVSDDKPSKIYVEIGMIGQGKAEIIYSGPERLTAGMTVVVNATNVLTSQGKVDEQDE